MSMRKIIYFLTSIVVLGLFGFYLFEKNIGTINISSNTTTNDNEVVSLPGFTIPEGFSLSVFAKDLPGARVMLLDGVNMYVSQTSEGKISRLTINNGEVIKNEVWLKN